ncbi:MAG TPA: sodium:calcium antiporter [Candidatus Binatia bacterium]|jgi:cation:H+ antiporter
MRIFVWISATAALCLQWIGITLTGAGLSPQLQALSAGVAIFGASFMLSWAAELAQLEIPQALALALLALIAVLPEYAVDMYFAWEAGKDPNYTAFATANMTGANRLLIGVGWATVVLAFWIKTGAKAVELESSHRLEVLFLAIATLYSFTIPFKGRLDLIDAVVFIAIFIFYVRNASRGEHVEPELEGPAETMATWRRSMRLFATVAFFVVSAYTIFIAAEPFAEGLLATGRAFDIEEFLLVQWLAPLASESPEFIVAVLFALRANPGASLGTLLSSKINQWTLLIGMLPVVYAISSGRVEAMQMDQRQVEELLLTAAQSIFAVAVLMNLSFSVGEALLLFVLFSLQLLIPDPRFRYYFSFLYIGLAVGLFVISRDKRESARALFRRA